MDDLVIMVDVTPKVSNTITMPAMLNAIWRHRISILMITFLKG